MIENFFVSTWYLWALVVLTAIFKAFQPKISGYFGEKTISTLVSFLPKDKYLILNNIMLKTNTGTTQIDHIVVSVYGIFVIETKNYKGWILGNEMDEYWTQNIYGKKNKFKNPIRQNFGHIKALEELLSAYDGIPTIPIVAFSGKSDLKVKLNKYKVVYFSGVVKVIKQYDSEVLNFKKAKEISDFILHSNIDGKETRKDHVTAIKKKVNDTATKTDNNICPKCGGTLVERNGRYGTFTGCSNYPKCRFTITK
ncbi:MAG: NERD domain-containing protein [Clostridia bacterium]|jgi:hypothetical protein